VSAAGARPLNRRWRRSLSLVNVLFVCVQNAGRSQIAEALFERATKGRHSSRSVGTAPAARVHPEVVEVMRERGIDLAGRVPTRLEAADAEWANLIVTMGCGDACPVLPGKSYIEWNLDDPAGMDPPAVRAIRDQIERRVEALAAALEENPSAAGA
jgi:arsenate reductase